MMKTKLYIFGVAVLSLVLCQNANAQCADDNINFGTYTPACPGTTTASNMRGGRYVTTAVTLGNDYTFSTCAAGGFDTQITIYNASSGAFIAFNDDFCGLQSEIAWTASFTGNIRVLVDRYNCRNSNNTTLTDLVITCAVGSGPPANDEPCGAVALTVGASCSYIAGSNVAATPSTAVADPNCGFYSGGDVWFSFVAPANGRIGLDTELGTLTDASMALYSATSCSAGFIMLECDDNDGLAEMPSINYSGLSPGRTYYVRVWGNLGATGTFDICAHDPPDCTFTLHMFDLGGNGWGGSAVNITIDGSTTSYTLTTGSKGEASFELTNGQSLTVRYTAGTSSESEISYILAQGDGSVFADGPSPTSGNVFSQTVDCVKPPAPIEDCVGGNTLCSGQTVNVNPVNIGITTDLNATNRGCLGSNERQGQWYNFSPTAGGRIEMNIEPQNPNDDYDFAIWGPYTELTCVPPESPLRCSYSGTTGATGLAAGSGSNSEGAGGNTFVNEISVNAGEIFIMYVSNWSRTGIASQIEFNMLDGAVLDCAILPISLLELTAEPEGKIIRLEWSTASEIDNEKFIIEHSIDGEIFFAVGETPGSGTTSQTVNYTWNHQNPATGINYYRLKQIDYDGASSTTQIITALMNSSVQAVSDPYPNPASNLVNLNVQSEKDGVVEIIILDAAGRIAMRRSHALARGTQIVSIPVDKLQRGSYTIQLIGSETDKSSAGRFVLH